MAHKNVNANPSPEISCACAEPGSQAGCPFPPLRLMAGRGPSWSGSFVPSRDRRVGTGLQPTLSDPLLTARRGGGCGTGFSATAPGDGTFGVRPARQEHRARSTLGYTSASPGGVKIKKLLRHRKFVFRPGFIEGDADGKLVAALFAADDLAEGVGSAAGAQRGEEQDDGFRRGERLLGDCADSAARHVHNVEADQAGGIIGGGAAADRMHRHPDDRASEFTTVLAP